MLDKLAGAPARSPLDAEHDQVEGVHGLDLQPARAAAARLVRRGQRLRHHPFVTGVECDVEKPLRGVGVVGDQAIDAMGFRHDGVEGSDALAGGPVQQVFAVEMQQVEHEHRQRLRLPGGGDVHAAPETRRRDLEPVRTPVGTQGDRLGVGDQVGHRQRQRRLDHLRQAFGDVVEAAGIDRHRVARAVDLHPRAVQLGLENRCAAEAFERLADTGRGLGQHRAHRAGRP